MNKFRFLFSIGSVYNIRVEIGLRAIVGYNAMCYSHNKQLSDPQVNSSWTSASLTAGAARIPRIPPPGIAANVHSSDVLCFFIL